MALDIPFDNSYGRLPDRFYTRMAPAPVRQPGLIKVNHALAEALGLDPAALESAEGVAVLAGNAVPEGADPLAQVYAGHQFGGWSPQLGDGRAILLGEVVDRDGVRRDIQLKGSGPTPYSRMGDGRAWLGPVLREYIVSEAMHALGVPTTRALAAVSTGEIVLRERPLPGAVLTRVAASHIRVGTFQYFAARQDEEALGALVQHAIARHYPGAETALDLLDGVIARQAALVATWLGLGFIHGVMNTDNTSISGETIDYGPCAYMDTYSPGKVFSSIDHGGRYAYNRQPDIMVWNLAQLATALLPVMGMEREAAIEAATASVHRFPELFGQTWLRVFRAKLGLAVAEDGDADLIQSLMDRMAAGQADFTNTFRALGTEKARDQFVDPAAFDTWDEVWRARLSREGATPEDRRDARDAANPWVIPRNHRIEEAIGAAVNGDFAPFERLLEVLARPYAEQADAAHLTRPPNADEAVLQTFCGT
ncbi:protein adenylyltransferase SelO [Ovoidimarina sediminis]|uniref:protein adenylyltransferase SelO n=1 Tax=Ovoidimarina sediminis TaxID=3079856 RepID=UPI00290B1782|nr:YdiU family protein [Rhodophyticola sp. MJ-SS7]MDU8945670.1 YdiU family protein [Rhodophyticola sp. MJ-SS7]